MKIKMGLVAKVNRGCNHQKSLGPNLRKLHALTMVFFDSCVEPMIQPSIIVLYKLKQTLACHEM